MQINKCGKKRKQINKKKRKNKKETQHNTVNLLRISRVVDDVYLI